MKLLVRAVCLLLLLGVVFVASSCVDPDEPPDTGEETQALVYGPPRIISTTINAPIVNGRYQLINGKAYTATVTVDAGTITYLTRVEANATTPTGVMVGYQYRDDTVIAYTGRRVYTFPLSSSTNGNRQVAFQIKDRGSNIVYNQDGGVPVTVSSAYADPRIVSTTVLNAQMLDGRYLLYPGQSYQVQVVVAMSNVTYSARVEAYAPSPTLGLNPTATSYQTMTRFAADRTYTFTITPSASGVFPLRFQLRDAPAPTGTGNAFGLHTGVMLNIRDAGAPRIVSTTIPGVTPQFGQYVLTIGKRYDVLVRVARGNYVYNAAVEVRHPVSAAVNLHNNLSEFRILDAATTDYRFSITPTDVGTYPISFQMRDYGTWNPFHADGGIVVVAAAPDAPHVGDLYGKVTRVSDGQPVSGVPVVLDTGATTTSQGDGSYFFSSVPAGSHRVSFQPSPTAYSPATAVNVTVPAAGIRVDVELEEPFTRLRNAGMPYHRYYDYAFGRTLFHAVWVSHTNDHVEILPSSSGGYETSVQIANRLAIDSYPDPGVLINGGYFDTPCEPTVGHYLSVGYAFYNQPTSICEIHFDTYDQYSPIADGKGPTLTITETAGGQQSAIVAKSFDFAPPDWSIVNGTVTWNGPAVDYAVQSDAWLVTPLPVGGTCRPGMTEEGVTCVLDQPPADSIDNAAAFWARTAVGVGYNGDLLLLVADAEGLPGRQGASFYQMSKLFAHQLGGVSSAMALDGGGSTQMAIWSESTSKYKVVNKPASEHGNHSPALNPVMNFLVAWSN